MEAVPIMDVVEEGHVRNGRDSDVKRADIHPITFAAETVSRVMPEIDGISTPTSAATSENEIGQVGASEATGTTSKVLAIIYDYALDKFDDTESKHAAGTPKFLSVIGKYVTTGRQVKMCLPAFPFKSANKVHKVFGALPDKAEELALDRLNTMCARIAEVYSPGAKLTIISDGLLYNDLLCIPDREVWAYGETLRAMAMQKGFRNIDFARLRDLVDFPFPLPEKLDEVTYVANATNFRRYVMNAFGKDDLDIGREIATNQDTLMTYCGYCRFLGSDLQYVFPSASGKMYRKTVKYMARQMLIRGYAFTGALKSRYPDHLRLSIHQSTGEHKVSLSLLNTRTGYTTPWHCGVALMADGGWLSGPVGDLKENPQLEVVYENGRPSYFRERTTTEPAGARSVTDSDIDSKVNGSTPTSSAGADQVAEPALSDTTSEKPSTNSIAHQDSIITAEQKAETTMAHSPEYGKRLILQILDALADTEPDRIIYSVARSADISQGFQEISARSFAQAVDKTAWWLHSQIARSSSSATVGYIGPHDLRQVLLTYACIKTGHKALFLSPKNSTEGALAVLAAAECNVWVQPGEQPPSELINGCLQQRPMRVLLLPSVDEFLDAGTTECYPYTKTFDEAARDSFCVLHTSGSTGLPKPVKWSHALIGTMDAVRLLPPVNGDYGMKPWTSMFKERDRIYSSFPMSHGAGILMDMVIPALFGMHCMLGPAGVIPNMDLIGSLADHANIDVWSMVPSLVDELGETPDVLAKLKSSKFICASGGPTSPTCASKVNDVVRVLNLTGTTEGLFIGNLMVANEDWLYFAFHPYSGFEFRNIGNGEYEHWCVRNQYAPLFQGIFHTFPDKTEINLKDLYVKHPTKPGHWAFKGRSDDIVVLSNGYKISPLDTEVVVATHPAISACLVVGTGKPQAALLIELRDAATVKQDSEHLLDSIWQTVQQANASSLHKNQLRRDYIMFAETEKPFVRTDKGTVKRRDTLALYADYIERFYNSLDTEAALSVAVDPTSAESITAAIREILGSLSPGLQNLPADADLFSVGLDSLLVVQVVRALQAAVDLRDKLAPRHLYANPTVTQFSAAVVELVGGKDSTDEKMTMIRDILETEPKLELGPIDQQMPKIYSTLLLYFPLRAGVTFADAFVRLQRGLVRTIELVPTLDLIVTFCSEEEPGYRPGKARLIPPPVISGAQPRQLIYKDLSTVLPSFEKLRETGFSAAAIPDEILLAVRLFPSLPTDVIKIQANFIEGGCLLAAAFHHLVFDGTGFVNVMRAWAESCRFLQGDASARCDWITPETMNRSLPGVIWEVEGYVRPVQDINPATWDSIIAPPPRNVNTTGTLDIDLVPNIRPPFNEQNPHLDTSIFNMSKPNLEKLRQDVAADPLLDGASLSASDIIQALIWRAGVRARYRAASELHGRTLKPDGTSILETIVDGRPHFSPLLPPTYMGNMALFNRQSLSLQQLCSETTSIAAIALLIRETAARTKPQQLFRDALTLMRGDAAMDYTHCRLAYADLGCFNMCISNLMLFSTDALVFGGEFFDNGGVAEALGFMQDGLNRFGRLALVLPMRPDGGLEVVIGTFPEELEMLRRDEEWGRYTSFVA